MKEKELAKLKLCLMGLKGMLSTTRAYFVVLSMEFRSGRQTRVAQITPQDAKWQLQFEGVLKVLDTEGLFSFFIEQAHSSEEAILKYTQRMKETILTYSAKGVQMRGSEIKADATKESTHPLLDSTRTYCISVDKAQALLQAIGIMTADGKLKNDKIRKYNQIDHYVELVSPMFEKEEGELVIVDCACGKSYLSFVLNYYLCEVLGKRCRFIGIDINEHVIAESKKMAQTLGYRNMEFLQADLQEYHPNTPITAVISLHACDIATDLALAMAVRTGAKHIACVPCCHKELLEQYQIPDLAPLLRQGVFRARMNDVLTDSLRTLKLEAEGYRVSAVEYISPLDTPKNLLIRATKVSCQNEKARAEYESVRRYLQTTSTLDALTQTRIEG